MTTLTESNVSDTQARNGHVKRVKAVKRARGG